jgi:hypothetical protein
MKRALAVFAAIAIVVGTSYGSKPRQSDDTLHMRVATIEKVIIKAFQSDDPEALKNAACNLRRLKHLVPTYDWDKCIIPLMHVLNAEEHDATARVIAAGILHELQTERGDFAISRNAQFSDDIRVKRYCAILAKARLLEKHRMLTASR